MKKLVITAAVALMGLAPALSSATPQQDLKEFREYYLKRFPGVKLQEFADGIYGIDKGRREEFEAMMEFPPYEPGLDLGKQLFAKYNVGKCFKNGGIGIRQNYPWFDAKSGTVHTLEGDIMACLKKNGVDLNAEKIKFGAGGKLAVLSAYMGYTSRGKKLNVVIPNDPRALAIYNRGKHHFYAKRGQLNMACADCHMYHSGQMARANLISPALGHPTHFPAYRKNNELTGDPVMGGFVTLEARYASCNKQVRAKPFKPQSDEYIALEYFETYMSNGIKVNAPGVRE
ncbi:MAG: sulfur oxidation c-type cytochrome SoxA [Gammaproteobacteria bacterium]|nr:sulfur oxidation c-type cytochrome SoxA [Gammaproteobacteria bacterium]